MTDYPGYGVAGMMTAWKTGMMNGMTCGPANVPYLQHFAQQSPAPPVCHPFPPGDGAVVSRLEGSH